MTDSPLVSPQVAANQESSLAQQQVLALEQQYAEQRCALEAQIVALEQARAADQTAAKQAMVCGKGREAEQALGRVLDWKNITLRLGEPLERPVHPAPVKTHS